MTITAAEMRKTVEGYNERKFQEKVKTTDDFVHRIVEPLIEKCARDGDSQLTIVVPLTINPTIVTEIIESNGFKVSGIITKTIEW